jgi:peroxisomal 2,4-dienoyl-CoA reductase
MAETFRPDLFNGRVIFVTGGGTGICKGIVRRFMKLGANAAIMGRRAEVLAAAKAELEAETGKKCFTVSGDIRDAKKVVECVQAVVSEYGHIDILINGAAGNFLAPFSQLSYNAFKAVTDIDTIGTYNVTKAVWEHAMKGR